MNLAMLHTAIQNSRDNNLDIESVKDAVSLALYENLHLFRKGNKISSSGLSRKRSNLDSGSKHGRTRSIRKYKQQFNEAINESKNDDY